ncbi:MAG: hypothetical protein M0R77_07820 [Gammaproteobacteria bacterium]|nr:hypothetical protein [Gammaproteobacteria bacterium]
MKVIKENRSLILLFVAMILAVLSLVTMFPQHAGAGSYRIQKGGHTIYKYEDITPQYKVVCYSRDGVGGYQLSCVKV